MKKTQMSIDLTEIIKNLIVHKKYTEEDILRRINVFYAVNQIDEEQYLELIDLVNKTYNPTEPVEEEGDEEETDEPNKPNKTEKSKK